MMNRADLLARMAVLLKREIGPAVPDAYPKTQAFLGAVVLEKLAAEMRLAETHSAAEQAERAALIADLAGELGNLPTAVKEAFVALDGGGDAALSTFIEALYAARGELGDERFDRVLGRVRQVLRRSIDRRMEIAA